MSSPVGSPRTGRRFLDEATEDGAVLALAHRGGVHHADLAGLENTLTAFRHATALGYRYLETDVHVSADGVLVAFHDAVLDRVTDATGALASLPLARIGEARIAGREPIPTLAELFDELPDARFNIDLKSSGAVGALADFVAARDAHDRVLVGSFSGLRLHRFRRRTAGRVATSASPGEVAAYLGVHPRGLARLVTGDFDAFQVPHRSGPATVAGAKLVRRAHADLKHVHVWTVDEPAEIDALLDLGVDGLFTDRTDVLRRVLVERGRWGGGPESGHA